MIDNLLIVSQQVIVLFVLIAIGVLCTKGKLLNEKGSKALTNIVLYLATPCVMIKSFQEVKYDNTLLFNLGISALCAFLILFVSTILCRGLFYDKDVNRRKVLQFATIFSNCGFMALPLQNAVLGSKGVFYGSVFIAMFNLFVWSYGLIDMSGDFKSFNIKKLILNPGILGVVVAVILFFVKIKLPVVISSPVNYLAGLNTPLPMLVIGYHLTQTDFKKAFTDIGVYLSIGFRLLIIPVGALLVMFLCGVRGDVLTSCTIAASAPAAATTTMFSDKFNRDTELSVGIVSTTSLLSIVTMPFIIALAQSL